MSLLWDYEEKTHRIIAGRKRKKVQKRIAAAVDKGWEVHSLTFDNGRFVVLMVDTFSVDRARKKEMSELASEYAEQFRESGFEHGLASTVHYIEGLRDLALGLSGPRLPSYDAYMDGFEQRETPLSDRVGAALTAIIRLECARIVGEAEAPKGPYRDRNLTRSQAGAYGQLLAWYYGWYDARDESSPDSGLDDNQHYMEGWNQFRKLETQAARRLEYQRNRERNGIGEVKNPPVTAQVSPAEVERAKDSSPDKPNGMPRSPEELRERITDFKTEQERKETGALVESNIPAEPSVSFSTDDPAPPIPPPDLALWLAFHNLVSGSKEERSYIHGWNRAAGGINPIPTGIDEWNDRGYQDRMSQAVPPATEEDKKGAKEHPSTVEDGMRIHGMHPESPGGKVYQEAWAIAMKGDFPAHTSFQHLLSQDVMPFFAQQGWKDGRRIYESENPEQVDSGPQSPPTTEQTDEPSSSEYLGQETYRRAGFEGDRHDLRGKSEPAPSSTTDEPAEDVPLLAAFGSYRARRNIPPRSGRGNYYRNGWCDAADALQVSLNLPDDPENGLRLAYLAGYNDYQEAVVMAKESA